MVKIKKVLGSKQAATQSEYLAQFIKLGTTTKLHQLQSHLASFPLRWPFPRGDLYHWIPLLNRFDNILELFVDEYELAEGPQTQPFGTKLLVKGDLGNDETLSDENLLEDEGDRVLIETILRFSRYLLDNCSNRSLYASSAHLNSLLNSTSISLLLPTLQLGLRLAQRYYALRGRSSTAVQHTNHALLAQHYAIDIDKIRKLSAPFPKAPAEARSPRSKSEETADSPDSSLQPTNLVAFATPEVIRSSVDNEEARKELADSIIRDFGSVKATYWRDDAGEDGEKKASGPNGTLSTNNNTPSQVRRSSSTRSSTTTTPSRLAHVEPSSPGLPSPPDKDPFSSLGTKSSSLIDINIGHEDFASSSLTEIIKSKGDGLPKTSKYDLLHRIRVASAINGSDSNWHTITAIRILAISNLSYVQTDSTFQLEVLQPDSDEPRPLQLIWQLAELVGPPKSATDPGPPRWLQAIAFTALEAIGRFKSRLSDVCSALSVTVNHGILIYVIRKAVADLSVEKPEAEELEEDEWREALFALLTWLPSGVRIGDALVSAGLLPIMAEAITLRTPKAERYFPKILQFLDTFVNTIRDAFQELANARGLDIISELAAYQVESALAKVKDGQITKPEYRTKIIDYQIPFVQQQTLRWLFKFMNHLMSHNGGTFDRLLRNLIDSPPLLQALKVVIENGPTFGSTIWGGAVNILSSFINNEPTSYAVIAEAGLSQTLLESISCEKIPEKTPEQPATTSNDEVEAEADAEASNDTATEPSQGSEASVDESQSVDDGLSIEWDPNEKPAKGILPAIDAIASIPNVFGAICLNSSGLELFKRSNCLRSFFEIFESPEHVKCLTGENDLGHSLGISFDEFVRHHPQLRYDVLRNVANMTTRIKKILDHRARIDHIGAKLWYYSKSGELAVCGKAVPNIAWPTRSNGRPSSPEAVAALDQDVEMSDAEGAKPIEVSAPSDEDDATQVFGKDCMDTEDYTSGAPVSSVVDVMAKFLSGFFSNQNMIPFFVDHGGFECLLGIAAHPALQHDFNTRLASKALASVLHMITEYKPHLTMPLVLKNLQSAVDELEPFMSHDDEENSFFKSVTEKQKMDEQTVPPHDVDLYRLLVKNGTDYVRALVKVHSLTNVLADTFSMSIFNHRTSFNLLTQVNLTDYYVKLATTLNKLHARCVWENILLQKNIPAGWKTATMFHGYGMGSDDRTGIYGIITDLSQIESTHGNNQSGEANGGSVSDQAAVASTTANGTISAEPSSSSDAKLVSSESTVQAEFRNTQTLRYLLGQLPTSITPFLQAVSKNLVVKRQEGQQRQNANAVADAIAMSMLDYLDFPPQRSERLTKDQCAYWLVMLSSTFQCLTDDVNVVDRQNPLCMTLLLQSFKNQGGLQAVKEIMDSFIEEVRRHQPSSGTDKKPENEPMLAAALAGIKIVLDSFNQFVKARVVVDCQQSQVMAQYHRERDKPDYFSANQFLVELRTAILPPVTALWKSDFLDGATSSLAKSVIELLKTVLEGESETGAYRKSEKVNPKQKQSPRAWKIPHESMAKLRNEDNFDGDIAKESLFRCYNNYNSAIEYCQAFKSRRCFTRNPIPQYELDRVDRPSRKTHTPSTATPTPAASAPTAARSSSASNELAPMETESDDRNGEASNDAPTLPHITELLRPHGMHGLNNMGIFTDTNGMAMPGALDPELAEQDLFNMSIDPSSIRPDRALAEAANNAGQNTAAETPLPATPGAPATPNGTETATKQQEVVTIEDLDKERNLVRHHLIEQVLNVLNVYDDVTFELSDLILTSVHKAEDPIVMQQEIGSTLIQSLLSLMMDDDFQPEGKKIASYAHLLGLVIRDENFFKTCHSDLLEHFLMMLKFIKKFPSTSNEESSSPWIAPVLLVIERLLAEDASPQQVKWNPPAAGEDPYAKHNTVVYEAPKIPLEEKSDLFDALINILHLLGKDEPLAHSATRVLVMLTRNRELALRLGERKNLQRLFVMVKGLAGVMSDKLQSAVLITIRHIVEDEETLRQIMRSEIRSFFDNRTADLDMRQTNRPPETMAYLRHLTPAVIRAPELFVEVTNELVKLTKYDNNQRHQILALKETETSKPAAEETATNGEEGSDSKDKDEAATTPTADESKATLDRAASSMSTLEKTKTAELKTPVVQNPDGVIHYLLSELLAYREVGDSESRPTLSLDATANKVADSEPSTDDVEMEDRPLSPSDAATDNRSKPSKPVFKAEQHPIYIYRCFILQCLTELLSCYNRTKVEFINFSPKRNFASNATPSKPRSTVLTYLLHDLIPLGTLEHAEDMAARKKQATSNWATQTMIALCAKTGEHPYDRNVTSIEVDEEPNLVFIRKFVLETSLKAFKEAGASSEPLHIKYARMLSIADLFEKLLNTKPGRVGSSIQMQFISQKQISKLMFEKGFIAALTASVADIDLNFPNAKRAVKYILRPIKTLTDTGLELSEFTDMASAPGQVETDEFSATSSVSDLEDGREETPDLFRNSALGMLDPGHEDQSSSESDDEDDEQMYDGDMYGEEMEYEEDVAEDEEDAMSEENMDDVGPIEGLSGDVAMDLELVVDGDDEDDDEDDSDDGSDDSEGSHGDSDDMDNDQLDGLEDGELRGEPFSEDEGEHEWTDDGEDIEVGDLEVDMDGNAMPTNPAQAMSELLNNLHGEMMQDADAMDPDNSYADDVMDEDEDDEDEDEDLDDEELMYEPDYDDEDDPGEASWEWDAPEFPPGSLLGGIRRAVTAHHHHHHHHRHANPWAFPPRADHGMMMRNYRHGHDPQPNRATEEGVNPLLQRPSGSTPLPAQPPNHPELWADWMHAITPGHTSRGIAADSPVTLISNLINAVTQGGTMNDGARARDALRVRLQEGPGGLLTPDIDALVGSRRTHGETTRPSREDPNQAVEFIPSNTLGRWVQETAVLYGTDPSAKVHFVLNALLCLLAPPAIDTERKRVAEEARILKEQREKKELEDRLAKEKAEKEAKEKAEAEAKAAQEAAEAEAARIAEEEAAAAAAAAAAAETAEDDQSEDGDEDNESEASDAPATGAEAMEGVEQTQPQAEAGPSNQAADADEATEQVFVNFHGQQIDITHLQIDPEYLDALPEEIREEVLLGQIAEARSSAANAGQTSTELDRDFLEALPDEIREELLEQEAAERRRRDREAARQQQRANEAENNAAAAAEEMDPASFLASLEPGLRQSVLMEQDEDILAQLPPAIAAEARALGSGDRRLRQLVGSGPPMGRTRRGWDDIPGGPHLPKKNQRKSSVQMLDKAGVATLLRLMFVSQQGTIKNTLYAILQNVCQNRNNRSEVVSLLLSILQDGTADIGAVERSFNKLSLRALQPPLTKEQQVSTERSNATTFPLADMSPLMVVQQCLGALANLTEASPPTMAQFFLMEHEASAVLKRGNRKGKGKESKASRYPVNSLMSLLDRKLILESSPAMETLSRLLNSLTSPVYSFLKPKDKAKDKEKDKPEEPTATTGEVSQTDTVTPTAAETTAAVPPTTSEDTAQAPAEDMAASQTLPDAPAEEPALTESQSAAAASEPKDKTEDTATKDDKKKKHEFVPPYIPDHNLSLMVNILTARECNARTFQDALTTTMHLSAIPGAKRVFGTELARQAQALGKLVLSDLDDLETQIKSTETSKDIQGVALSKFSPASADQAKLLRVLTAIDYIFDSKRKDGKQDSTEQPSEPSDPTQDGNVGIVYESATFGPLWSKLSDCLTGMRDHKNSLNVATILLPLVESLMMICKNTPLKDLSSSMVLKGFELSSPPPEDRMEHLFFIFTEEHRKVLNDLVRQNPKLMSGTFSLLVKNPKVLEFDNKRSYFTRRLHSRGTEARHPQAPLQLSVRRDFVFLDSFKHLYYKTPQEMKYGKLSIRFHGEEGVDAGGVTREWFQVLARQMFDPNYALFTPVASDRTTFHPNRLSAINDQHLMFFKFIGRVIGKALYEGRVLDCHFSRAVYKRILGRTVSIKDMETLDLDYSKSLKWMLENDITDIITETFSIESDDFGEKKIIELVENGANIAVTEENKHQYVQAVVEYKLTGSVEKQLEQFLSGFHDIVPAELISIFNEQELELLISGLPDIDVNDWKNNTEYHNYSASSSQIQWFWRALNSFDKEERAKLLQFVTGTSKVPLNGFKELEGMNGVSRFNIHRDYGSKDRLPSSHTCFNQLDLPEYDSYDALRKHILMAITAGSDYFGFA